MTADSRPPTLIVVVVALLFGAVAVWTGSAIAERCLDSMQLRNAAIVEASILRIDRQVETAGDGTRELVFVTYAYQYAGRRFELRSRRLTLFGDSSTLHGRLENAMRNDESVPCYVSKSNPSLSVFSREFSFPLFAISLIFPLGFGTVSLIATWSLFRSYRRQTPGRTELWPHQSEFKITGHNPLFTSVLRQESVL